MSKAEKLIAAHPLECSPYNKLIFSYSNGRVPVYTVEGCDAGPSGAYEALGRAFAKYGGKCFYCPTKFKPQAFSNGTGGAHRDHVIASSRDGSDLLHNLVIACAKCGRTKGNDTIHDFRPRSAKEYLDALNKHIEACLKMPHANPRN